MLENSTNCNAHMENSKQKDILRDNPSCLNMFLKSKETKIGHKKGAKNRLFPMNYDKRSRGSNTLFLA